MPYSLLYYSIYLFIMSLKAKTKRQHISQKNRAVVFCSILRGLLYTFTFQHPFSLCPLANACHIFMINVYNFSLLYFPFLCNFFQSDNF